MKPLETWQDVVCGCDSLRSAASWVSSISAVVLEERGGLFVQVVPPFISDLGSDQP